MKRIIVALLAGLALPLTVTAQPKLTVREIFVRGDFPLAQGNKAAVIYYDQSDFKVVAIAAGDLAEDMERVTGVKPLVTSERAALKGDVVILGTLGRKGLVDELVRAKKINAAGVAGKWESAVLQTAARPLKNVSSALVIAGSDRRGTAFGVYELSSRIGVSPWYWWADVPVRKKKTLSLVPGRYVLGEPAVKYRGIFLNDEEPALGGWAKRQFGGINSAFYKEVFELLLRLKANFLWPAMWGKSFFEDDPKSPGLADDYAVVIGTSHHEPMMRAHVEWQSHGSGVWNYEKNEERLKKFWRQGIERMGDYENLVTIGMRGDGDEPMSAGNNIPLLERIVADQRRIIEEVTGKKPEAVKQVWALYKEVQGYYDQGMRVPDDVTLLLCDDNWGNIRRLPALDAKPRPGGYGIYYHFDYVGGPRNYKWINTNPLPKIWEQMNLAYQYNVRQIWVVNVGDLKPMELPISFFLDYARDPRSWLAESLGEYTRAWAEQQFGKEQAAPIAEILAAYAKYNGRRKPELLAPNTYSLVNYGEAERVLAEYRALEKKAVLINDKLDPAYRDAYYQLVLYPVKACANFLDLYITTGKNHLGVRQGRAAANDLPDRINQLFETDAAYAAEYHKIADGKWNQMMAQVNIGYVGWQEPRKDQLPRNIKTVELKDAPEMGVAIEGSEKWWPEEKTEAALPEFNSYTRRESYIEVFNRGKKPFEYAADVKEPWLKVEPARGTVEKEARVKVEVDWAKAPVGQHKIPITLSGAETSVVVQAVLVNPGPAAEKAAKGFIETDGYVAIEAAHFSRAVNAKGVKWLVIPDYGRTLSGVTPTPATAESQAMGAGAPRLEYSIYTASAGEMSVQIYLGASDCYFRPEGLRYALSFDDEAPVVVNAYEGRNWDTMVQNNAIIKETKLKLDKPGAHTLKVWMVDPAIVFQKIVIDTGKLRPSYLGPPESPFRPVKK